MAFNAEIVRKARMKLATAKEDKESLARQRLAQAYREIPRLQQIDKQLQKNMAYAAKAAFSQGGSAREAMEQVKQENLALQQERQELVAAHFGPNWLDESPICDCCGGSGYIGANMCRCLTELCRQEQKNSLNGLCDGDSAFSRFRLDYYPDRIDPQYGASARMIMEKNFRLCRTWAATFTPGIGNLLFIGGTGLGKTFLSGCIAGVVADRGYDVMYENAADLLSKLEQARFNSNEETRREAEKLHQCDLLIIDDLGTEMPGQFTTAALYHLINDRLQKNMSMLISTNLNVDELSRRYSPQIASRLHGSFQRLTFVGEDIRVMKNRGL